LGRGGKVPEMAINLAMKKEDNEGVDDDGADLR